MQIVAGPRAALPIYFRDLCCDFEELLSRVRSPAQVLENKVLLTRAGVAAGPGDCRAHGLCSTHWAAGRGLAILAVMPTCSDAKMRSGVGLRTTSLWMACKQLWVRISVGRLCRLVGLDRVMLGVQRSLAGPATGPKHSVGAHDWKVAVRQARLEHP